MLHRTLVTSIFVWTLLIISGCSVFMAANQPASKNLDLFSVGTPRDMLLAEFGLPSISETKDGKRREIFTFKQGYGTAAKTGRAVFHGVADFFTLGLWEVVGTPIEICADDRRCFSLKVFYDCNENIKTIELM